MEGCYAILGHEMKQAQDGMIPLSQVVTEDVMKAETGLTIKICMWNWHFFYPTSNHDELPLYLRKESNYINIYIEEYAQRVHLLCSINL